MVGFSETSVTIYQILCIVVRTANFRLGVQLNPGIVTLETGLLCCFTLLFAHKSQVISVCNVISKDMSGLN
jgi:hypothetical protein